jgi:PiT family inorganic phosphate transporter
VAGLTGASIAICHGISGINFEQWIKVLIGLFIATFGGFILAYLITKIIEILFRDLDRRKAQVLFGKTQVFGDLSMVFMNGAQDGQKLLAILIMGTFLSNGVVGVETFTIPIWMLFLCSIIMTIGTWVGAKRIIKTIGVKMTKIETYQGTAADIASFVGLLFASFLGIPMSTTQTKITSVMGVGAAKRFSSVDWSIAKNIVITWFITFPGCGIMGYIFTNIIMKIFA